MAQQGWWAGAGGGWGGAWGEQGLIPGLQLSKRMLTARPLKVVGSGVSAFSEIRQEQQIFSD